MPDRVRQMAVAAERDATLVDALTSAFGRELAQVIKFLNAQIRADIRTLQTAKAGRLIATRANLARVLRLRADLLEALHEAGYARLITDAIDEPFDAVAKRLIASQKAAGTLTRVYTDALAALKDIRLAQLLGLQDDITAVLWRTVLDGVLGARSVTDLVDDLADALDLSARQARVIYDTALSTYARQVEQLHATGDPDEAFVYLGPVDSVARAFCLKHVGRVYTRAEIDTLDNGIKGYANVMLTAGGPNCRHIWRLVPQDDTATQALVGTTKRVPYVQAQVDRLRQTEAA